MVDNWNHISDDEESEWLVNIDPSLLDESNEEKQLDDHEISSHALPVNKYQRNSPEKRWNNSFACWIMNNLLDVFLCSIAEYFYSLFVFWLALRAGLNLCGKSGAGVQSIFGDSKPIRSLISFLYSAVES